MARRRIVQVLGAGAVLGTAGSPAVAATDGERTDDRRDGAGLITVESDADFETTVARVEPALEERGLLLVTTVDHAANAATVGMDLPPTTLFLFGNPEAGTPLMQANRSIAIDLPQKLLVWEADGNVFVTYNDPRYLARRHGVAGRDELLANIDAALEDLAVAVARGE